MDKHPLRNGSVFEALILTRMQVGEVALSTSMSLTSKCLDQQKRTNIGTVNSEERRKPKKAKVQAAQNIQWSGREVSSD